MKKITLTLLVVFLIGKTNAQTWSKVGTMSIRPTQLSLTLTYKNKAYIFGGELSYYVYTDSCWEYDPSSNTFTVLPPFPAGHRKAPSGFIIGDTAYVGFGEDDAFSPQRDFYALDLVGKTWTKKATPPINSRYACVSFAIGKYGYVATGSTGGPPYSDSAFRYDPSTDKWQAITSVPYDYTEAGVGASVNGVGYIFGGYYNPSDTREIVGLDTSTNSWSLVNLFPDSGYAGGGCFSFCNKLYLVMSTVSDTSGYGHISVTNAVFSYNPAKNIIKREAHFPGAARAGQIVFQINGVGYVMGGYDLSTTFYNDIWKFTSKSIDTSVSICHGDTVHLLSLDSSKKYIWNTGDTAKGIRVDTAGKFWVVLDSEYCIADTFSVSLLTAGKPSFNSAIASDTVVFINTSSGYSNIKWLFGDGDTSTLVSPVHIFSHSGKYAVKLITYSACGNDTLTDTLQISLSTSTRDIKTISDLRIFPNPASNFVDVEFTSSNPIISITIIDALGRAIQNYYPVTGKSNEYKTEINIGNLVSGIYIIQLKTSTDIISNRVIKK